MEVPTFALQDFLLQIRHQPIEVKLSSTADDAIKRIWQSFSPLQVLVNPENDEEYEYTEFPGLATFGEAYWVVQEVEHLLRKGLVPETAPNSAGSGKLKPVRHCLKLLLLHQALQQGWEFSATCSMTGSRMRLPLAMMEHRGFLLDDEWHSAQFGSLEFYNLHIHRHDLSNRDDLSGEQRVPQRLGPVLTEDRIRMLLDSKSKDKWFWSDKISVEYLLRHRLLEFYPKILRSVAVSAIYAKPFRNSKNTRGPKSKAHLTREIFLSIAGPEIPGMSLSFVIALVQAHWAERFDESTSPPLTVGTIRLHLKELEYWVDEAWNMHRILDEKSKSIGALEAIR